MCSSLSRVLTLRVAIFSQLTLFQRLFLTQIFLAPLHEAVVDQSRLLGHGHFGDWGHGSVVLCMLVLLSYPSTLASVVRKGRSRPSNHYK